jgi:hypothetical protein
MSIPRKLARIEKRLDEIEQFLKFMDGAVTEMNRTLCHLTEPVWELERKKATKKP